MNRYSPISAAFFEGAIARFRAILSCLSGPQLRFPDWQLFVCIALVAGGFDVWLLIGWREINPSNLSWLWGDAAQYEVGWEFLRHETTWTFPPTWVTRLDYPTGVSASYLDFIPLLGVFFRFFSPILPADFQYLGLYAVACYVLQTYFGLKLTSLFANGDRIVTLIGGAFFLLSPILTERLYGHFPHSTHWVLVACIYYYFRPRVDPTLRRYLVPFLVLSMIAAAITPYIALMANLMGVAAIFRAYCEDPPTSPLRPLNSNTIATPPANTGSSRESGYEYALWSILIFSATALVFVIFGFIVVGATQLGGGGYTDYSMNILAPINPQSRALLLRTFPVVRGQAYESYNYLGLGILSLLALAIARSPRLLETLWSKSVRPLTIASIVFTLLAISLKVTFADKVLFTVTVPKFLFNLLSAFRASGRLFWPVHYLLILAAIAGTMLTISSRMARRLVLVSALLLQYFDLLPLRDGVSARAQELHPGYLIAPDWAMLSRHHKHFVILPALQCGQETTPGGLNAWPSFARLVARSRLTLNSAYLARITPQAHMLDCVTIPQAVMQDGMRPDTAYVVGDALAIQLSVARNDSHFCRRVDGFNLCTHDPGQASRSPSLGELILPEYQLATELQSEKPTPRSLLLENFDQRPGWGRWTLGPSAAIYFRLAKVVTQDLRLEMSFTNALMTPRHNHQRALISVNGHFVGTLDFLLTNVNDRRSLTIPSRWLREGAVNVLRFVLPDAAAPAELGINRDPRLLALSLHRLRIVAATRTN